MGRTKGTAPNGKGAEGEKNKSTRSPSPSSRLQSPPSPESERPIGPLSVVTSSVNRDAVKVNKFNRTDLKNACDDAVKRYLSRPELFKQNHLHTDIRLGLGWLSVFVAAGTALYGYKIEFEQSKPVVTVGLVVYLILTTIQSLYAWFIEGSTIFVGTRKTVSNRIISERININSETVASPATEISTSISKNNAPFYHITISYLRQTNSGKSLLAKGRIRGALPYSTWFDEEGQLDQDSFERWIGEQVEQAMDGKNA